MEARLSETIGPHWADIFGDLVSHVQLSLFGEEVAFLRVRARVEPAVEHVFMSFAPGQLALFKDV